MRALGKTCRTLFALGVLCLAAASAVAATTPNTAPFDTGTFDTTPSMRRWLRWQVPRRGPEEARLRRLDRALNVPRGLELKEVDDWSGGAREVFERREADCVGYAFLFYALASELGIAVEFVIEAKIDSVESRPGLEILRRHLAVAHRSSATVWDFGGPRPLREPLHEPISRSTAVAILESNRGTQALLRGDPSAAVDALSRATAADPTLAAAWSNLSVALRRSGWERASVHASVMASRLEP